jgi:hypothetical protein
VQPHEDPLPTGGVPCIDCGQRVHTTDLVEYAGLSMRAFAAVVDVLFFIIFLMLAAGLLWMVALTTLVPKDEMGDPTDQSVFYLRLVTGVAIGIYFWSLDALSLSPGKRYTRLKVVRAARLACARNLHRKRALRHEASNTHDFRRWFVAGVTG